MFALLYNILRLLQQQNMNRKNGSVEHKCREKASIVTEVIINETKTTDILQM